METAMSTENEQLNKVVTELTEKIARYEISMFELKQRSDIQDTLNEMLNITHANCIK